MRYKVCPVFKECPKNETKDAANCAECPLHPGVTNFGFMKLQLKSLILFLKIRSAEVRLRYPAISFCFRLLVLNVFIPFLAGAFIVKIFFK